MSNTVDIYDLALTIQCALVDAHKYRDGLDGFTSSKHARKASVLITELEKVHAYVRYMKDTKNADSAT